MRLGITQRAGTAAWWVAAGVAVSMTTASCSSPECDTAWAASLASDASGPTTPRAALAQWLTDDHAGGLQTGAPTSGWTRIAGDSRTQGVTYGSSGWRVTVSTAPAGGWLPTAGTTCR